MANMTNTKAWRVISIFLVMLGVQAAVGEEIREIRGSNRLDYKAKFREGGSF